MNHEQKNNELYALVYSLITELESLKTSNAQLQKENIRLSKENIFLKQELEKYRTPKNSGNSSKPPSSGLPKLLKTQSLRTPSGKKPGGQPGHEGTTLKMAGIPDTIQKHSPNYCTCCGEDLSGYQPQFIGRRQVIDIPPIKPIVTEHHLFEVHCRCGHNNKASYPDGVLTPVSYGPGVQSLVSYLSVRQYLPVERITELLSSLCGLSLSTGGVCYLLEKVKQKALPVYETIRQMVANGKVIGADETGVNINGKINWAWTFQNPWATYIAVHESRGKKAINQIMPEGFRNNILVTDCWAAYFKENPAGHQLCTAHLLRELKFFTQKYPENTWAPRLSKLITDALHMRKQDKLSPEKSKEITQTFLQLIKEPVNQKIKELISFQKRMVKYSGYVFAFLDNPNIPPDNNASERAIRNFKVKLKVSNLFKSTAGSQNYAVIRSVIDTAIKNQQNPYEATRLIAILPATE
ncbi:MAG: IS66 family transposase [Bacteroidota bacterium]|nr:IS66 family transposase [Bacteroidota bacterium]